MPFKLKIFSIGKTKEAWLEEAVKEYIKRLSPYIQIEGIWAKDNDQLVQLVTQEKNVICCDSQGEDGDSIFFAKILKNSFEKGGTQLSIVIGGSEGLPQVLRERFYLFSFSKLTFTHQMVRLILMEQIYRATQIWKGSPYHK